MVCVGEHAGGGSLWTAGTITGTVLLPGGAVAYLATVTAVLPDGMTYSGSTAGNGSFSIGSLPPGSYTLAARLFPNAPATASVTLAAGQTLAAGTLTLGSPSTVTGLVKDSAGTGLTGVTVQIT
ncbi:MAG: carboxypeptidase-like regulatory domain-containing protein, partial [Thermoanaerobaculia bacterium]|nr:carboxypeptidase-like regulatory domain-containing protein [Thermoanaerobaculia bacterium]